MIPRTPGTSARRASIKKQDAISKDPDPSAKDKSPNADGEQTDGTETPIRVSLVAVFGFGYEGGHPSRKGIAPDNQVSSAPLHRHEVSLDFAQYELGVGIPLNEQWDFRLRIPFSIKRQKAEVRFDSPVSGSERDSILKNQQVHHRSETYQGLGDPTLLLSSPFRSVLFNDDVLSLSGGLTVPLGRIEGDPFEAGDKGREHLHIQFGTGTLDPVLEFQYESFLSQDIRTQIFASSRLPFYENRKGYQAPIEVSTSTSIAWDLLDVSSFYLGYLFYFQGYGHWNRTGKDENSGLISHNIIGGLNLHSEGGSVTLEVRIPLSQETLDSRGDTFEQQPSFLLAAALTF